MTSKAKLPKPRLSLAEARAVMADALKRNPDGSKRILSPEERETALEAQAIVIEARKAQMARRGHHFERDRWLTRAFLFVENVVVDGRRIVKGDLPAEFTPKDQQLLPWGLWMRDTKRAMDATAEGEGVPHLPFPPVPTWFMWNPGRRRLADELGIAIDK